MEQPKLLDANKNYINGSGQLAVNDIEILLEAANVKLHAEISLIAEQAKQSIVIPYCNEKNYSFNNAGAHGFWFAKIGEEQMIDDDLIAKSVIDVLNLLTPMRFELGHYMDGYRPELKTNFL